MLAQIVDKFIRELEIRLKRQEYTLIVDQQVKDEILKVGQDSQFGARPIKRHIQKHIETLIAYAILKNDDENKTKIQLSMKNNVYDVSLQ